MLRRAVRPDPATHEGMSRGGLTRAAARVVELVVWLSALAATAALLWVTVGRLASGMWDALGVDPERYLSIARRVVSGELPYVDFTFEYPPLALPAMVLPLIVGLPANVGVEGYAVLLVIQNLFLVVLSAACLLWLARRGWSASKPLRTVVFFGLLTAATPVVLWRFDALPALLTVLALVAAAVGRPALSGIALGLGAAVKLYPLALLPIEAWRELAGGAGLRAVGLVAAALGVVGAIVVLLLAALGPAGLDFLAYQTERGVQIESLVGSALLLADTLNLAPASVTTAFRAYQVDSTLEPAMSAAALGGMLLLAAAFGASLLITYRRDRRALGGLAPSTHVVHLAAALILILLAYRVLSPQFLAWLLPFAALLPRPKVLLVLVICVLSLYVYPVTYHELINLREAPVVALALRNGLLVLLFAWLVMPGVLTALRLVRQGAFGSR